MGAHDILDNGWADLSGEAGFGKDQARLKNNLQVYREGRLPVQPVPGACPLCSRNNRQGSATGWGMN